MWAASALGGLAQSLAGAAGALMAGEVTGSDAAAGLPQALLVAGSAAAALALSHLTVRRGRRAALTAGAATAAAGCLVVLAAAVRASLPLVLVGSLLIGAGTTAVMLGRYAAADLSPDAERAPATATALAATTIGAVTGPNLLAPAGRLANAWQLPDLAGAYLLAGIGFALAAATLAAGLPPRAAGEPGASPRHADPATAPILGPDGLLGLVVLSVANLVMVAVMTMAPVQLHHLGHGLAATGLLISLHIAAMFAPAPVSGRLTQRLGARRAATTAGATMVTACGLAAAGADALPTLIVAMVLLGAGWNLALIAGSVLLTSQAPAPLRPRLEGWGEISMGLVAAGGSIAAGPLMAAGSYPLLAATGAAAAGLLLAAAAHRGNRGCPSRGFPVGPTGR